MDLVSKVKEDGTVIVNQGVIAGCSGGTYGNIMAASAILNDGDCGNGEFRLSIYPDSMPVYKALVENGTVASLISTGAIFREAFCGPCFGAGEKDYMCSFDASLYEKRVFNGYGKEDPDYPLHFGPNIKDWPEQPSLSSDILLKIVSHIDDPVTTTDELIPSGETSSYRSNPLRLAEFTLSRRDPDYVNEAKKVKEMDWENEEVKHVYALLENSGITVDPDTNIASSIYAYKPGDGSAREQAASCQRVLGAGANFAHEYATKRYRSNCINWGMLPFLTTDDTLLEKGSWVLVKNVKEGLESNTPMKAYVVHKDAVTMIEVSCGALTRDEIEILEDGCLINYYKYD